MKLLVITRSFAIVGVFLLGLWLGHEWEEQSHRYHSAQVFAKGGGGGGGLTNPLLECGIEAEEVTIGERAEVEESVTAFIKNSLKSGSITDAAVYFRDLNNGPWFGINERDLFEPGSLLKLPIAMSLYYWDSRKEGVLDDTLDLTKSFPEMMEGFNASNASLAPVPPAVYTVRDLIGIMLRDSSNDAANVLAQYEGAERMGKLFFDLGIMTPKPGELYQIDVKTFGAFLRVLYNASYLGREDSEELLTTLTQTTFRDGIVAGVPQSVKVAHKFGTRVLSDGSRQLHDCGIVYTDTPYILCVMTQGNSADDLMRFIARVSKDVYEKVSR